MVFRSKSARLNIGERMKQQKNNYILAFVLCLGTTVLGLMGENGLDNIKWFILSDINVAIYLFVAWFFDWRK